LCLLAVSAVCGQDSDGKKEPADGLAARSLAHSAMLLRHASGKPPGRAARLVGLTRFALRLAPDDAEINSTAAYIALVRGKDKAFATAITKSFAARPADHALGLQWLSVGMRELQDAASRADFLSTVVADAHRPPALRAAAAVERAKILMGQDQREKAREAFEAAVKLDPYLPAALEGRLALLPQTQPSSQPLSQPSSQPLSPSLGRPSAAQQADVWAKLLTVNPHAMHQAAQLGEMLDAAGLYEQAMRFYHHAWRVNDRLGMRDKVSPEFVIQYCNAMLNAGLHKDVYETLGSLAARFSENVLFRVLLIEACNRSGQTERAKVYANEIEVIFAPKTRGGQADPSSAAELAWLYLITNTKLDEALKNADHAHSIKPDAPGVSRVLAAARLLSGKKSIMPAGRAGLKKIADKDVFAAAFLAEYYYTANQIDDGKKMVLGGLALSRSGQAARRLMSLARKHEIEVPPTPGSAELDTVARSVSDDVLALGRTPEKFISLKIIPAKQTVDAGCPIVVRAELTSTYPGSFSVGPSGLIPPAVSIDVTAEGRESGKFIDTVRLTLPAGKYLTKGRKIAVSGRIDLGELHGFLVARPLDRLKLTVSGRLIDPAARRLVKPRAKPLAAASSATIVRDGILGEFDEKNWPKAYRRCLSLIVGDMRVADPKIRMRAANQTASLLVLSDGIDASKLRPPEQLTGEIDRNVLVLMTAELLKDRSDVVRAEMLTALGSVKLDGNIIRKLAGVIRDPSPLVRFRLVELLGASGLSGQGPILTHFTKDKYDLVAQLAKELQPVNKGK